MVNSPPNEQTPILETGKNNDTQLDILNTDGNVDEFFKNPFGEKHDKKFWDDVCIIYLKLLKCIFCLRIIELHIKNCIKSFTEPNASYSLKRKTWRKKIIFFFQLKDRNKENSDKDKVWITSLNELRLEKIQEASNKNDPREMMLHFMGIYDRCLDEAVKQNKLGMMSAIAGEVNTIIKQFAPRILFEKFLKY